MALGWSENSDTELIKTVSIFIAVAFSLFYISLIPVLRGEFVIHAYPPWSVPQVTAYVLGGILVQGWFCFGRVGPPPVLTLLAQIVMGVLYAAAVLALSGSIYQT
jgi:hypothetical protein